MSPLQLEFFITKFTLFFQNKIDIKLIFVKISCEDTITAIATPYGVGAISVIRVTGPQSISSIGKILISKIPLEKAKSHSVIYGKIIDKDNSTIDDILVTVFKSPNSYTGENSVEISTHGNPLISSKILERILEQNVRLAEPGEFTKRAFLNGKIDLSQAEAVVDVINARTNASLKGARNQLDGLLSQKVNFLRQKLIESSSLIELELDFAEEDLEFISLEKVNLELNNIIKELQLLIASFKYGKLLRDGINVALVGKPNVGKSSLLNLLVKESRAIVSPIPGTTRDIIREEVSIDGLLFKFFDTAGIRVAQDEIEEEGVSRSKKAIEESDIIVLIYDVKSDFPEDLYHEILKLTEKEKIIFLVNKIDLGKPISVKENTIEISAKTGEGTDNFLKLLKTKSFASEYFSEKSIVISNIRHKNALEKAKEHLLKAVESINNKLSGEFIAIDLRSAANSLGEIIGIITTDDILNNIFSKFCIGK